MSKHSFKVVDFPTTAANNPHPSPNNALSKVGFLTVVKGNGANTAGIALTRPVRRSGVDLQKLFMHGEYLIAIPVTLALHLLWFFAAPTVATQETVRPPKPISVAWFSDPHAHAEPAKPVSQPQAQKDKVKPMVKPKPKPKPRKVAVKTPMPSAVSSKVAEPPTVARSLASRFPPPAVAFANPAPVVASTKPSGQADMPVAPPHLNANYLDNPVPDYPAVSREFGEQGRVLVRAKISADGKVEQVLLRKSSGFARLDHAAIEGVKHWRFVPAQRGPEPVPAWVVVPVAFALEG